MDPPGNNTSGTAPGLSHLGGLKHSFNTQYLQLLWSCKESLGSIKSHYAENCPQTSEADPALHIKIQILSKGKQMLICSSKNPK